MLIVLDNLPKPMVFQDTPHPSGAFISGANVANGLVSILHGGPLKAPSFTVGVTGRGSLNVAEPEFKQLLGCMAAIYRAHYGSDPILDELHGAQDLPDANAAD